MRAAPLLALAAIGGSWGATQPLSKIAVMAGYKHLGLIFWQAVIVTVVLGALTVLRGRKLVWDRRALALYVFIAVVGTIVPGIATYSAFAHLPSGIMSILISTVPLLALPVALAMGNEQFHAKRLVGLILGFAGVALLILPDTSLPAGTPAIWIGVALLSSACYALEGNGVARWGTGGLDAVQVLAGASVVAAVISLPLALATGHFINPLRPWGLPEMAIMGSGLLHAAAYSGYVGLVGWAGSVFAAQVGYFVTAFGVLWAMLFLGESYTGWVWAAMGLLLAGVALVQPLPKIKAPKLAG